MKKQTGIINILYSAGRETLRNKNYLLLFAMLAVLFFFIYVLIPVFTVPGNDLIFQLKAFTLKDYFLIIPFSLVTGLMLTTQIYSFKKYKMLAKEAGTGMLGSSSGFIAGMFGSATCVSCISALFGFLGIGSVIFLVNNRWWIVSIGMALVLLSLFFTSKRIVNCETCNVKTDAKPKNKGKLK